jgi:PmbA protein
MRDLLESIITKLSSHGAESDLIYTTNKSLKMSAQKGEISEFKVSSSQVLGARVIKEGRVGISFTEAMDEESLNFMIVEALRNAKNSHENIHEKIIEHSGNLIDCAFYNEEEVDLSTKVNKTLELESLVKKGDSFVTSVPHNSYAENEFTSLYLSSSGRFTSFRDKVFSVSTSALMDHNGKKANYYDSHFSHRFCDLDWDKVIKKSLFYAREFLNESPLPTGKYHVTFSADCLQSIVGCFSNFFSGKAAMDKINPWSSHLGQQVVSTDLSIHDIPQLDQSFRKSFFDSEGVEQCSLTLIEDGKLKSLYHNSVTANYFSTLSTGHASRSPLGPLGISGTHLLIQGKNPGTLPPKYVEIIQMDGLFSGANRVNGNFSVAIKGHLWERGERIKSVGNCTLSGNFQELLKNVEVTGTLLSSSTDGTFFTVPLLFGDLSIAGV